MNSRRIGGLEYFTFGSLDRHEAISCCTTTRLGGLSAGPFESLNLGLRCGDDPELVRHNRAQLSLLTSAFPDLLTFGHQVHGDNVAVVGGSSIGSGATEAGTALRDTDAMVTGIPDVPLVILVADCCPISLYDPVNKAVGLAHAGWRGTAAGIAGAVVETLAAEFGSDPSDLVVGVGPSIGPCCYQVGSEVKEQFAAAFPRFVAAVFSRAAGDKVYFDLPKANRLILTSAGVRDEHIESAGLCTSCRTDLFFSHRAERGRTGRCGAMIMLHDRTRRVY